MPGGEAAIDNLEVSHEGLERLDPAHTIVWYRECPPRVIFDRSNRGCVPTHVCFTPKAGLRPGVTGAPWRDLLNSLARIPPATITSSAGDEGARAKSINALAGADDAACR
jgi:hypothetical protein